VEPWRAALRRTAGSALTVRFVPGVANLPLAVSTDRSAKSAWSGLASWLWRAWGTGCGPGRTRFRRATVRVGVAFAGWRSSRSWWRRSRSPPRCSTTAATRCSPLWTRLTQLSWAGSRWQWPPRWFSYLVRGGAHAIVLRRGVAQTRAEAADRAVPEARARTPGTVALGAGVLAGDAAAYCLPFGFAASVW